MEGEQLDSILLSKGNLYDVYLIKEKYNCKILKQISDKLLSQKEKIEKVEKQLAIEAKILKMLKVKSIPFILEQKKEYLIFQYISGITLKKYNKEYGMSLLKVYKVTYKLLIILRKIHNQNIIHCDLKPENIIIEENLKKIKISIIDFGSATIINELSEITQLTPKYSPNELFCIKNYRDKRIDIYSIFKLIDYMLSTNEIKVDTSLIKFIKKGKEENREERYQSIDEILKVWKKIRRLKFEKILCI